MRDIFKKAMAGSMIAGAALIVAACQPADDTAQNNVVMTDTDPTWNEMGNDVTAMDATGNEAWGNDMGGNAIDNAMDHLDNAQQELQNAQ
jgi:hypothetical protein